MGTIDFISSKPSKKQENNAETSQNTFHHFYFTINYHYHTNDKTTTQKYM